MTVIRTAWLGISVGCLLAFGNAFAAEDMPAETQREVPSVTVEPVRIAEVQDRVPISGSLVPREEVLVFPKVTGYAVTDLFADVGDQVAKGQELARLQDDTLSALYAQAEAENARAKAAAQQAESQIGSADATLAEATAGLERARRLRQSGNNSQAALDQAVTAEAGARAAAEAARDGLSVARAAMAQSDAAHRIARLNLDNSRILAPVDGTVVARNANIGELSGSSAQPMFTIVTRGEIELAAEVIETAIARLRIGAPVELQVSGIGSMSGEIRLLPAQVDPATRLGTLRVALDGGENLRSGLFASGWIVVNKRDALTVPVTAILADGDGDHVQVLKDNMIETRPVKAGLIWNGRREVREGLAEGEVVLTRAGAFFRTGDHVRPVQNDAASSSRAEPDAAPAEAETGQ